MMSLRARKIVAAWLLIGVIMVFCQVLIGGITRLTDSGLSITEWKVVEGTLPPLNQKQWTETFDKYKTDAKKQFETLHPNMTLDGFKRIYFWEYFHRLWARSMGLVFIFPFIFFLFKRWIDGPLMVKLLLIIGLASLEGLFGWIMVASGLNEDNRTWVSAYKLLIHLSIATFLFAMLVRTYLSVMQERTDDYPFKSLRKNAFWLIVLVIVQIMFGGLMAGMRAGLIHPYFPIFLHWDALNAGLHSPIPKTLHDFVDYEPNAFLKFIVQILHRSTAGILVALLLYLFWKGRQITGSRRLQIGLFVTGSLVCIQFLLGVITITQCVGHVPAFWGVLHQGTALILLASLVYVHFQLRGRAKN